MRRVLLVAALIVAACSAEPSPADAAESYFRALAADDCATVRAVVLSSEDLDCSLVTEMHSSLIDADGFDVDGASFAVDDVVDDSAVVEISWDADRSETIELQRVDGTWLVVLDTAA